MNYNVDKKEAQYKYKNLLEQAKNNKKYIIEDNGYWTLFQPKDIKIDLPRQGFKIHLSATTFNINTIFSKFFDYIKEINVEWKVLSTFRLLERQNIGFNGFSQVGKFITIYPASHNLLIKILHDLNLLFKNNNSIQIPSDF